MYDAIVVGARVAGAPTAMLLARKGYRVLLVDRATFPSDIMSTHFIHTEGIARLRDWGLLDAIIASGCPPISGSRMDFGEFVVPLAQTSHDGINVAYCPRRTVLDAALVEAATAAGVEVRQGFSVREILKDGDRVTGIRGRAADGSDVTESARIVIGADGMHSQVARAVNAPEYNAQPSASCAYYSYWSGMELGPIEFYFRDKHAVLLFPTNNGEACIGVYWPGEKFHTVRDDIEGNFWSQIDGIPALSARMRAGKREERFIGTADLRNFYRKPFGPGWALAGDAGYHKDPILGWGIADAFRDADLLSEALDCGFSDRQPLEDALAGYEQKRNAVTAQTYQITLWLASLPPPMEVAQMMSGQRAQPAESAVP